MGNETESRSEASGAAGADPEYSIACLSDFLKVPPERLADCLSDFRAWLALAADPVPFHAALCATFDIPAGDINPDFGMFYWTDDGIAGIGGIHLLMPDGERIGTLDLRAKCKASSPDERAK